MNWWCIKQMPTVCSNHSQKCVKSTNWSVAFAKWYKKFQKAQMLGMRFCMLWKWFENCDAETCRRPIWWCHCCQIFWGKNANKSVSVTHPGHFSTPRYLPRAHKIENDSSSSSEHLNNVSAVVGETALLSCRVDGDARWHWTLIFLWSHASDLSCWNAVVL